ncbi:MAG: hypothetical protein IPK53_07195 [bacterium]|nr:hypothetical protein [bacterium]
MSPFINRHHELTLLDNLIQQPGAHLIMLYGRRRIGKTTLITYWARQTSLPTFYWVAKRDPRDLLLGNLGRAIYGWQHGSESDVAIQPRDWEQAFKMLAQAVGDRRAIVILDELPYALQQDSGLGSHLQAAWDHLFKESQIILILSGSHIGMLTDLIQYQSPLYGRLTAQFPLYPCALPTARPSCRATIAGSGWPSTPSWAACPPTWNGGAIANHSRPTWNGFSCSALAGFATSRRCW